MTRGRNVQEHDESPAAEGASETEARTDEAILDGSDDPSQDLRALGVIESYGGRLEGALKSTGTLVVHGEMHGDIAVEGDVYVSAGSAIVADIHARSISAGGRIKGSMWVPGDVELPPRGRVDGDIHARSITVHGAVNGALQAEERVHLESDARVRGDITCRTLIVADGAFFSGRSRMDGEPAA